MTIKYSALRHINVIGLSDCLQHFTLGKKKSQSFCLKKEKNKTLRCTIILRPRRWLGCRRTWKFVNLLSLDSLIFTPPPLGGNPIRNWWCESCFELYQIGPSFGHVFETPVLWSTKKLKTKLCYSFASYNSPFHRHFLSIVWKIFLLNTYMSWKYRKTVHTNFLLLLSI